MREYRKRERKGKSLGEQMERERREGCSERRYKYGKEKKCKGSKREK